MPKICFKICLHITQSYFSVLDGSQGNIPLESVTNAYVQMINHGNSNGPVSSDSQTPMMRNAHVTGIR